MGAYRPETLLYPRGFHRSGRGRTKLEAEDAAGLMYLFGTGGRRAPNFFKWRGRLCRHPVPPHPRRR